MAAGVPLLLFCALLYVAGAQDPDSDVPATYRSGVDLAIKYLNSQTAVPHHYRFFSTVNKTELEGGTGVKYLYQRFNLKPTLCAKGTNTTCLFRNDRPLMDCAVCYKTELDQIQLTPEPFVHCIQKPKVTQVILIARTQHCNGMVYLAGETDLFHIV